MLSGGQSVDVPFSANGSVEVICVTSSGPSVVTRGHITAPIARPMNSITLARGATRFLGELVSQTQKRRAPVSAQRISLENVVTYPPFAITVGASGIALPPSSAKLRAQGFPAALCLSSGRITRPGGTDRSRANTVNTRVPPANGR
ncbi:MAG: hypothetical protein R3C15_20805 [Thermoleophilia bacterium]